MKFLYLWPLAFLILIPIIIIMYLLKQKAVDQPFSSLKLWRELYKNMQSNMPWEKLKKNLLMYVQILTVLVLIAAIMSPYIRSDKPVNTGHVIMVIDTSGSMNTMYNEDYTRFEAAIAEACDYVDRLSSDTAVSVITSDKDAALVITDSTDKSLIKRKLKDIEVTNYIGEGCNEGVKMAESMVAQWEDSEVVYFSDSFVACESTGGYIVSVYSDAENALIEYMGHGMDKEGKLTVIVKVVNNKKNKLVTDINLYGDGEMIAVSEVSVESGDSKVVYFEDVNFDGEVLMAELNDSKDALANDDVCYDVIKEKDKIKVLLMTEKNLYLEKAISLVEGVEVTKSNDIDAFFEFEKDGYDLYIFDGMIPTELPDEGSVIIFNCENDELYTVVDNKENAVISTQDTKCTKYLADYRFGASKVKAMEVPYWADSFLAVGELSAGFIGNYDSQTLCVIGLDVHDTDLPLKTEFPILIYSIMEECVNTGVLSSNVLTAGNSVKISGKLDAEAPKVVYPAGKSLALSGNIANFSDTNQTGIYKVNQKTDDGELRENFVVNFPKSESVIKNTPHANAQSGDNINVVEAKAVETAGSVNLRNIIIIIALIMLFAEWIIYIRR
ncbi:MAG: BatA and WFA domain-containing protein [Lachnospiraceae bacterium]|nr:BatA and WFA domain-containing protein [Lachnospiraceae bacterium]